MDQINTQPVPTTQITPPAKSGLLRWILVASIVVVSIGGIVAYTLIRKATNTSTVVSNYSVSPSAVPVVTGEIAKTNNLTGKNQYEEPPITLYPGAKVYTSQKWGIRFQYPASKQIEITEPDRLSEDGLLNEAIAINVTQASRDALSNATLFAYYIRTMPNDSSRSFDDNLRSYFVNRINFNDCSIVTPKQKLIKSPGEERYIAPTTSDGIVNYCGNVGVYGMGQKREISSWKDASTYFVLPSNNSSYIYVIDGGYVYGGSEGVLGLDSVWQDTIEFLPKKTEVKISDTESKFYKNCQTKKFVIPSSWSIEFFGTPGTCPQFLPHFTLKDSPVVDPNQTFYVFMGIGDFKATPSSLGVTEEKTIGNKKGILTTINDHNLDEGHDEIHKIFRYKLDDKYVYVNYLVGRQSKLFNIPGYEEAVESIISQL